MAPSWSIRPVIGSWTSYQTERGLQEDLTAMKAGLTIEWSHGVTEGHVHRLKLVKRQGYGRVGFALLRQRVLQAAYAQSPAYQQ